MDALTREVDPPTTVRDPHDIVRRHVADSLAALEIDAVRVAERVADLGSGAGFPGLVLAAALPAARVDLLESVTRKCAVIERVARVAELDNARAVPERAETWGLRRGRADYDLVTARALASLPVLVEYAAPLLMIGGALVAWKGARVAEEEAAGDAAAVEVGLSSAVVCSVEPFVGAHSRHLHAFRKVAETPARFPRRPGMAVKRPLA